MNKVEGLSEAYCGEAKSCIALKLSESTLCGPR